MPHFRAFLVVAAACAATFSVPAFARSAPIPGQYIVVFQDHVANPHAEAAALVQAHGGRLIHSYGAALKGFAAQLPDAAVQALQRNPNVNYVEQDQAVRLSATQTSPTWGLDRIDQRSVTLDGLYNYNYTGTGVYAFIIDTGIRADHVDFGVRVLTQHGYTAITDGNGTNDCNGHGTHVAGTVGGATWGVAKQVSLVPVRVLDCSGSGTYSGVIAGINHAANSSSLRPAVANMSLGGGKSSSVNSAVAGAVSKGVTMAVAAGNDNADACNYSPASEPTAVTVAATTSSDARASYSNFGACVDLFAPGSGITSAWYTSSTSTNTISGTSMATPHVAGVAALAAEANPGASPATIASLIFNSATPNKVSSAGTSSPNLLLYSLLGAAPTTVVAVSSLTGTATSNKKSWTARVTIGIRDVSSNAGVTGVTLSGSFSPGGGVSCVTGSTGSCTVSSPSLNNGTASTVYTVTGATGTNLTYDSSQNTATQLRVNRP